MTHDKLRDEALKLAPLIFGTMQKAICDIGSDDATDKAGARIIHAALVKAQHDALEEVAIILQGQLIKRDPVWLAGEIRKLKTEVK